VVLDIKLELQKALDRNRGFPASLKQKLIKIGGCGWVVFLIKNEFRYPSITQG
jgi:hypothetical protein